MGRRLEWKDSYIKTKTTSKPEGEVHVWVSGAVALFRVVHEDWKKLIESDGMKGQEGIDYEIDI